MKNANPEVLAPAGSFDAVTAAVRSGADAVYFGHTEFSARRNAENFDNNGVKEVIIYCKKNKVKTYLTLNISLKDNELEKALDIAKEAYLNGIDGFIVSDLGLAKLMKKAFPEAVLHASTQLSVNSPSALKILKDLGFCRVVPSREMNKKDLSLFCGEAEKLGMEVEVFVHGALCMCLSGQCLLSSVLGARSGNRGLCAGPCRLPFSAQNGTGYDLSLKDLSLFSHVEELKEMGVKSLKIEGRMKRPEYIACAVTACRSAVDSGIVDKNLSVILQNVFSRSGFTDGYFENKTGRDMFGVRSKEDAIKSKETYAFLHSLYRNEKQKIPISFRLDIRENKPIKVTAFSGEYRAEAVGGIPQKAANSPLGETDVKATFSKLGGTPFFAEKTEILLDGGLFVSKKELNEIRRKLTDEISDEYIKFPQRTVLSVLPEKRSEKVFKGTKIYAKFNDLSQIPEDLSGVDTVIIPLEKADGELPHFDKIAVSLPLFTENEKKISEKLEKLKKRGIFTAFCGTLSAVKIAARCGFEIVGDTGLNVYNCQTADVLCKIGLMGITVSAELNLKTAECMSFSAQKGVFAYGRLPLMTFKNCPLKNGRTCEECDKKGFITDRMGEKFPINCKAGHCEMLNSKPLYLADKLSNLQNFDYLILSFTTEKAEESERIINAYKFGTKEIKDFTRGLYFKEVL